MGESVGRWKGTHKVDMNMTVGLKGTGIPRIGERSCFIILFNWQRLQVFIQAAMSCLVPNQTNQLPTNRWDAHKPGWSVKMMH